MINPQWLELPMSRTDFHGPKDVRAIEVRLYFDLNCGRDVLCLTPSGVSFHILDPESAIEFRKSSMFGFGTQSKFTTS